VNVWPDSLTTLYGALETWPGRMLGEGCGKHYLDLVEAGYSYQAAPVPIAAIFVLGERSPDRDSPSIRPMPPRSALMALTRHTYGSSFLDRAMRAREFDVLCRLVEQVPVRELRFGDNLEQLVSSCRALADNVHE
jgi:hypothetical protein